MIDPYDRTAIILLLRRSADHIAQGITNDQLADHLEQED